MLAVSLTAQNVLLEKQNTVELQLRNSTRLKSDSTLTYAATGELSSKTHYEYDSSGNMISETALDWINNEWVNVSKATYEYNGEYVVKNTYQWESSQWKYYSASTTPIESKVFISEYEDLYYPGGFDLRGRGFGFSGGGGRYKYKCTPTYNSQGYITSVSWQYYSIDDPNTLYPAYNILISYNTENKPTSIVGKKKNDEEWMKVQYQYNSDGELIFFEELIYNEDTKVWEVLYKYEYINGTMVQVNYGWDGTTKIVAKTDSDENIYTKQFYSFVDNKWYMTHYSIYYPNSLSPAIMPEGNDPVNNNQGNFDLNIHIPTDSISNGSFTITFPEGFTLDEDKTSLALDFGNIFKLTITKEGNNSWIIEIKPESTKSTVTKADEVSKLLHIAYTVDAELVKGSYDISINSILFETPNGNYIPEPSIILPVNVNRSGVSNEQMVTSESYVYVSGSTLYIKTNQTESVSIYSINGLKLYQNSIQSGTTTINTTSLSKGILIVKGSSGWVKKIAIH